MDLNETKTSEITIKERVRLLSTEKIALCYIFLTLLYALLLGDDIPAAAVTNRLLILAGTAALWLLHCCVPQKWVRILRNAYQLALLAYWYPDIYYFSQVMPSSDHFFAQIDQEMFHCQPSVMLSQWLSGFFWQELFNMGYFSYYLMIAGVVVWAIFKKPRLFNRVASVTLCSFMLYYLIFLFVESAGPQFYFPAIGADNVKAGVFPAVGHYFQEHSELTHTMPEGGLFTHLVHAAQGSEKPIAAFPSSHVGLSTILLLLAFSMSRRLSLIMLPFYIILCVSTVYIGAHYAIDVFGGWVSAIIIFGLAHLIYYTPFIHGPKHHHHHRHKSKPVEERSVPI